MLGHSDCCSSWPKDRLAYPRPLGHRNFLGFLSGFASLAFVLQGDGCKAAGGVGVGVVR